MLEKAVMYVPLILQTGLDYTQTGLQSSILFTKIPAFRLGWFTYVCPSCSLHGYFAGFDVDCALCNWLPCASRTLGFLPLSGGGVSPVLPGGFNRSKQSTACHSPLQFFSRSYSEWLSLHYSSNGTQSVMQLLLRCFLLHWRFSFMPYTWWFLHNLDHGVWLFQYFYFFAINFFCARSF